jgi:hypothetical protein
MANEQLNDCSSVERTTEKYVFIDERTSEMSVQLVNEQQNDVNMARTQMSSNW